MAYTGGHLEEIGAGIIGRAVNATLYVSPNGTTVGVWLEIQEI